MNLSKNIIFMAHPRRFERLTFAFGGQHIRISIKIYKDIFSCIILYKTITYIFYLSI